MMTALRNDTLVVEVVGEERRVESPPPPCQQMLSASDGSPVMVGRTARAAIHARRSLLRRTATIEIGDAVEDQRPLFESTPSSLIERINPDKLRRCRLIAMCGLPARGKTFIARKSSRYLRWLGFKTYVFSLGTYRRRLVGANQSADFFDHTNAANMALRDAAVGESVKDMIEWFRCGGQISVFDASNVTVQRREKFMELVNAEVESDPNFPVQVDIVWIESICTDPVIIQSNIRESKLSSPDYKGVAPENAVKDYLRRIQYYQDVYETITGTDVSFVKLINGGSKVIVNNIEDYTLSRLVFFLTNLRIGNAYPLYISRHGESEDNVARRIGGDSSLTSRGHEYGQALREFCKERYGINPSHLKVWTSTLKRTIQTGAYIQGAESVQWRALTEIEAGDFDGLEYDEIKLMYPHDAAERLWDKLRYRFPRGESYLDVIQRLEPILFELERRSQPVLIVAHKAVMRCLYGYFIGSEASDIPSLEFPTHAVVELDPKPYGCQVQHFELGIEHCESMKTIVDVKSST